MENKSKVELGKMVLIIDRARPYVLSTIGNNVQEGLCSMLGRHVGAYEDEYQYLCRWISSMMVIPDEWGEGDDGLPAFYEAWLVRSGQVASTTYAMVACEDNNNLIKKLQTSRLAWLDWMRAELVKEIFGEVK